MHGLCKTDFVSRCEGAGECHIPQEMMWELLPGERVWQGGVNSLGRWCVSSPVVWRGENVGQCHLRFS